jgi:hypothetical protein
LVTSNTLEDLDRWQELVQDPDNDWEKNWVDLDCITTIAFSWGHSKIAKGYRQEGLKKLDKETWDSLEEQISSDRTCGLTDWWVDVQEYPLRLKNETLWLGTSDKDWHRPLLSVFRNKEKSTVRRRSEEAKAKRAEKWSKYQGPRRGGSRGQWQGQWWSSTWGSSSSWEPR